MGDPTSVGERYCLCVLARASCDGCLTREGGRWLPSGRQQEGRAEKTGETSDQILKPAAFHPRLAAAAAKRGSHRHASFSPRSLSRTAARTHNRISLQFAAAFVFPRVHHACSLRRSTLVSRAALACFPSPPASGETSARGNSVLLLARVAIRREARRRVCLSLNPAPSCAARFCTARQHSPERCLFLFVATLQCLPECKK